MEAVCGVIQKSHWSLINPYRTPRRLHDLSSLYLYPLLSFNSLPTSPSPSILLRFFSLSYRPQNHSLLFVNLALGDLMMGVYLLIIAGVDITFRGVYRVYEQKWRSSLLCQAAGFFSTFSSEASVFTLTGGCVDGGMEVLREAVVL